ncbi:MAG: hypothetical protein V3T42_00140, partial [Nitrospirales bacterium]
LLRQKGLLNFLFPTTHPKTHMSQISHNGSSFLRLASSPSPSMSLGWLLDRIGEIGSVTKLLLWLGPLQKLLSWKRLPLLRPNGTRPKMDRLRLLT